jgi:tetratricopeptide (TPR) repeat protein
VQGEHDVANRYFREAIELSRRIGDKPRLSFCLQSLGLSSLILSDWETAEACFKEAIPLFEEAGNQMMVSGAWSNLGTAAFMQGNLDLAQTRAQQGLAVARRLGDPVSTYFALYTLSQTALARGDLAAAGPYLREGLSIVGEVGNPTRITYYLETYALILAAQGDLERAARVLGASEAVREAGGVPRYIYLAAPGDLYERTVESLPKSLGKTVFDRLMSEGRLMTALQAIAYALDGRSEEAALAGSPFGAVETEPQEVQTPPSGEPVGQTRAEPITTVPRHPLVGRETELRRLESALERAATGSGSAVLIHGEPGIGKTRLVEELVARASDRGFITATGGGVDGGSTPAHWPWVVAITALLDRARPEGVREALGAGAAELAQVVPEVNDLIGRVDPPVNNDAETGRMNLFQAVAGLLAELGKNTPLLVVLEDLQWADVASLQLLGFLGPRLKENPVLLVGTYRPDEVGPDHPLRDTLAVLARHQAVEQVELNGLDETGVAQLISLYSGISADPNLLATVNARTEGNPFFVTELARLLAADARLGAEGAVGTIPSGVRDVVRRRLSRLPAETNAVLSTAAVIGRDFELRVVSAAFKLDTDGTLGLVEAAVAGGLVAEHPRSPGVFRFNHDLVRETILEGLTAARRAMLHARIAEALEAVYGDAGRPIEIAYHFSEAASVTGPGRAVPHILRAAESAIASLAYEQAGAQLDRALQLVDAMPTGPERDRRELDIYLRRNTLTIMTRGYAAPELAESLERARVLSDQLGEMRALIPVRWGLVSFHNNDGNTIVARRLAEELLNDVSAGGDPAELVAAHLGVGIISMFQGELQTARHHLDEVLSMEPGLEDPWLLSWLHQDPIVSCSTFQIWCLTVMGESELAGSFCDEAVGRAIGLGNDFDTAHALYFASAQPVFERRITDARRASREAVEFARQRGFHSYGALGSIFHGWARALEGEAEAGVNEIKQTLNAMAGRARIDHSIFLALLAEAHLLAGQPTLGMAVADQGLDVLPKTGERFYEAELHRIRGEILLEPEFGRRADAIEALKTAVAVAGRQGANLLKARAETSLRQAQG